VIDRSQDARHSAGPSGIRNRWTVWNSRRGNHLGSGHVRPRQQTGHMIASDPMHHRRPLASRGPSTYGSRPAPHSFCSRSLRYACERRRMTKHAHASQSENEVGCMLRLARDPLKSSHLHGQKRTVAERRRLQNFPVTRYMAIQGCQMTMTRHTSMMPMKGMAARQSRPKLCLKAPMATIRLRPTGGVR